MATNPIFKLGSTNMEYQYSYNQAVETVGISTVDARVRGGMITLCEFAGNQFDPDKKRQCKHFDKSKQRSCCMYYREEYGGACDCIKE